MRMKDGTESWTPLRLLKESNPVDVAEYLLAQNINNELTFSWWVPYTLRKRDFIVLSINSRFRKRTHKYDIEIPTSRRDAIRLDTLNVNIFWADSRKIDMINVGVAFEILKPGDKAPPGWKKSSGRLIHDVKMDFTQKIR